jgi:hypothetical protein
MNQALLALGILGVFAICVILIFITLNDELHKDNISDALKKIILNYLQLITFAAALPMQWPGELRAIFLFFDALGSGGKHMVNPDCNLSDREAAQVFYMKQIAFSLVPVIVVLTSFVFWHTVACLKPRRKSKQTSTKVASKSSKKRRMSANNGYAASTFDKTILTVVLLNFLFYPSLVTSILSMFSCVNVGQEDKSFLMADLQEPCFSGRHESYVIALGLPQIFIYMVGFPLMSILVVGRNRKHLDKPSFKFRYAMLYLGYRNERWWWEIMTVLRKIATVLISVFGVMLGPDLQCFLVLAVVFVSLFAHLLAKPFDVGIQRHKILHAMELGSLCVCWATFWAGLIFFLGKERLKEEKVLLQTISMIVVSLNLGVLILMVVTFVKEARTDKKHRVRRMSELKDAVKLSLSFQRHDANELRMWSTGEPQAEAQSGKKEKAKAQSLKAASGANINTTNGNKGNSDSDWL